MYVKEIVLSDKIEKINKLQNATGRSSLKAEAHNKKKDYNLINVAVASISITKSNKKTQQQMHIFIHKRPREKSKLNEAYKRVQMTEQREGNEQRYKNRKRANVAKRKDRMAEQKNKTKKKNKRTKKRNELKIQTTNTPPEFRRI